MSKKTQTRKEFKQDIKAYKELSAEFKQNFSGQWVAFYKGEFVAVAPTKVKVMEKVRQVLGDIQAFICPVNGPRWGGKIPTKRRLS